jgi:adenine phosphoribosyltransferase
MDIKSTIRTIPDFPKKGIMFRDITTLIKDPVAFKYAIDTFVKRYADKPIKYIVGIESRGFIIGGAVAYQMGKGFIPIRKPGKLPGDVASVKYELEYGTDQLEIHTDAINDGDVVVIIDDLLATGGTCRAAVELVKAQGAKIYECGFIVELPELEGRAKIGDQPIYSMVSFEGH